MKKFVIFATTLYLGLMKLSSLTADSAYAQVSSLITQTPKTISGSLVKMEIADLLKNFELSPSKEKLIAKQTGTYFVMISGQAGPTSNGVAGYIDCWFMKNDTPIPNSSVRASAGPAAPFNLLITQFIVKLNAGDSLATMFTASTPSLGFVFIKPDNEPAIPSFILSVTQVE